MRAVWSFLVRFKFDYLHISCPLKKMRCDRRKLYGLLFHLFCSEFVGIYPVCASLRRICPTPLLKKLRLWCVRKLYCAGSSGPREAEQTHPVGTHTKNTHIHLIQTPGTVLRRAQENCPFLWVLTLCSHIRGSLILWGCGDQLVVSWWILDSPRRTQC